jgi:hypothetical protein
MSEGVKQYKHYSVKPIEGVKKYTEGDKIIQEGHVVKTNDRNPGARLGMLRDFLRSNDGKPATVAELTAAMHFSSDDEYGGSVFVKQLLDQGVIRTHGPWRQKGKSYYIWNDLELSPAEPQKPMKKSEPRPTVKTAPQKMPESKIVEADKVDNDIVRILEHEYVGLSRELLEGGSGIDDVVVAAEQLKGALLLVRRINAIYGGRGQ